MAVAVERGGEERGIEENNEGHEMTRSEGQGAHQRGRSKTVAVASVGEDKVNGNSMALVQRRWEHDVERGHANSTMMVARTKDGGWR